MAKEYIERKAVFDHLAFCRMEDPETKVERVTGVVRTKDILAIPAADVVEVVRCKDCKHRGKLYRSHLCDHPNALLSKVTDDDFCSQGERRDN